MYWTNGLPSLSNGAVVQNRGKTVVNSTVQPCSTLAINDNASAVEVQPGGVLNVLSTGSDCVLLNQNENDPNETPGARLRYAGGELHVAGAIGKSAYYGGTLVIDADGTSNLTTGNSIMLMNLIIGDAATAAGNWIASGKSIVCNNAYIGRSGFGRFTHQGRSGQLMATNLYVGLENQSQGTLIDNGSTMSSTNCVVGAAGVGELTLQGDNGTLTTDGLVIGNDNLSAGMVTLDNGTVGVGSSGRIASYIGNHAGSTGALIVHGGRFGHDTYGSDMYVGTDNDSEGMVGQSGGTILCRVCYVGNDNTSHGTVAQTGGQFSCGSACFIGKSGHGELAIDGAGTDFSCDYLTMASDSGSEATGTLSTGTLSAFSGETIGGAGTANFEQASGLNRLQTLDGRYGASMGVATGSGGQGHYDLKGQGKVTIWGGQMSEASLTISGGASSTGSFDVHENATLAVGGEDQPRQGMLYVASGTGSTGSLTVRDSAKLIVNRAGSLGRIYVATGNQSTGTLEFSDAPTIWASDIRIGVQGTGHFTQSGGTVRCRAYNDSGEVGFPSSNLCVAHHPGSSGEAHLSGGEFHAFHVYVGHGSEGVLYQTGGTLVVHTDSGETAFVAVGCADEVETPDYPHGVGSGEYYFTGGSLTGAADLRIRQGNFDGVSPKGVFVGHGTVGLTGTLRNNGQVIADGDNVDADLDMTSFTAVNAGGVTDNLNGTFGWYARNHGRLLLPPVPIRTGPYADTYWGDGSSVSMSPTNSFRMTFTNVTQADNLSIALVALDHGHVTGLLAGHPLPEGWNMLTAWEVSPGPSLRYTNVNFSIRYDNNSSVMTDESKLMLIRYDATTGQWVIVSHQKDLEAHRIFRTALAASEFTGYFAVAQLLISCHTLTGTVDLPGFVGSLTSVPAAVEVWWPEQDWVLDNQTVNLNAEGRWSITTSLPSGTYDVSVKPDCWLSVTQTVAVRDNTSDAGTASYLSGDADGNDQVNFTDFSAVQSNYGQTGKVRSQGDFNGDGQVTFEDFAALQNHYGHRGPTDGQVQAGGMNMMAASGGQSLAMAAVVEEPVPSPTVIPTPTLEPTPTLVPTATPTPTPDPIPPAVITLTSVKTDDTHFEIRADVADGSYLIAFVSVCIPVTEGVTITSETSLAPEPDDNATENILAFRRWMFESTVDGEYPEDEPAAYAETFMGRGAWQLRWTNGVLEARTKPQAGGEWVAIDAAAIPTGPVVVVEGTTGSGAAAPLPVVGPNREAMVPGEAYSFTMGMWTCGKTYRTDGSKSTARANVMFVAAP